jgi:hypothetical protein
MTICGDGDNISINSREDGRLGGSDWSLKNYSIFDNDCRDKCHVPFQSVLVCRACFAAVVMERTP